MQNVTQALRATRWIFFVCGLGLSSWAPMVPLAKERLALNDAGLGLLLLLLGAGAIVMMPVSGILVHKFGSRIVVLFSSLLLSIILPSLVIVQTVAALGAALFLFGVAIGTIDVAMNTQAVRIQNMNEKPIMSSVHGLYSVGGLVGPVLLGLLIKTGVQPFVGAVVIALCTALISIVQYKFLLDAETEKKAVAAYAAANSAEIKKGSWLNASVFFLGTMCFIVFLAEGALLDWSAIFLREDLKVEEAMAGLGYAAFSVAMAVMRLLGDGIISRLNEKTVVMWGAVIAASGFFIAISFPYLLTALLGFIMVGIGAANIVPVFFSEGGRLKNVPPAVAIPAITTMGYAGQLVGPAILGFIAFRFSITTALAFNAVLLLLVALAYKFKK